MRRLAILLISFATLGGCARAPAPAPAAGSPTQAPEAALAAAPEGAPRIVTTPDLVHLEYHVYGRGDPLVVLVHGWNCNSNYWNAQLEDLKARYTVVTLDLAGHGASGHNRSNWSMAAYGGDVATVVNLFPRRPVVLVGHSMGGPVVVEAAHILGGRVAGVIVVDSMKGIGRPHQTIEQVEAALKPFRADFIGSTRKLVTDALFSKSADPEFVRKVADDMSRASPEVALPSIIALQTWDPAPALATLKAPLIAIDSDLGPPVDAAAIVKVAPTFRLVTIPGTDHFLMMEDPKRFNPVLLAQIEGLAGGGPHPP